MDLGLSEAETENLDLGRYEALAERVHERNKLEDFRTAKIQCAIFQAMWGKWGDGREISIADFLPPEQSTEATEKQAEQNNARRLKAAFDMMAARDAKATGGVS